MHIVHINGVDLEPSVCVCSCICVLKALALVPGLPRPFHIQVCAVERNLSSLSMCMVS